MDPQAVLALIDRIRELLARYADPAVALVEEWLRWGIANLPRLIAEAWSFVRGIVALVRSLAGA